nr:MAG TPA: hypothetical protein [Caudoviricetes sp.]
MGILEGRENTKYSRRKSEKCTRHKPRRAL